jgi:hypothetical protein
MQIFDIAKPRLYRYNFKSKRLKIVFEEKTAFLSGGRRGSKLFAFKNLLLAREPKMNAWIYEFKRVRICLHTLKGGLWGRKGYRKV